MRSICLNDVDMMKPLVRILTQTTVYNCGSLEDQQKDESVKGDVNCDR
jgi:hypothetical protein